MVDPITTPSVTTPVVTETPEDTPSISETTKKLLTILSEQPAGGTGEADTVGGKPELVPPSSNALEMAEMLASLKAKINEAMTGIAKENIEKNREDQLQKSQERIQQIKEAAEAMDRAKTWGVLGKVFGWLIPALMVVAGAALAIAGGVMLRQEWVPLPGWRASASEHPSLPAG